MSVQEYRNFLIDFILEVQKECNHTREKLDKYSTRVLELIFDTVY